MSYKQMIGTELMGFIKGLYIGFGKIILIDWNIV